jgi:hypothetical protein
MARMNLNPQPESPRMPPDQLPPGDRVRQGVTGHGVRYILLFSLLGAIAAFVAVGSYLAK